MKVGFQKQPLAVEGIILREVGPRAMSRSCTQINQLRFNFRKLTAIRTELIASQMSSWAIVMSDRGTSEIPERRKAMASREVDPLHKQLCHTIRLCCPKTNSSGVQAEKGLKALRDLALTKDDLGISEWEYWKCAITGIWSCGESAPRLCQILAGADLSDYGSSKEAIKLSEGERLNTALEAMKKTSGYFLVRINEVKEAAGHSYIFLSEQRSSGEALKGYIYQTNIGIKAGFDLVEWIDDAKSQVEVNLDTHLHGLIEGFTVGPLATYRKEYMLTSKPEFTWQEEVGIKKLKGSGGDAFVVMWKPVTFLEAQARLNGICLTAVQPSDKAPNNVALIAKAFQNIH